MATITLLLASGYRVKAEAAPDDLDPNFGTDGKVLTNFAPGDLGHFDDCALRRSKFLLNSAISE